MSVYIGESSIDSTLSRSGRHRDGNLQPADSKVIVGTMSSDETDSDEFDFGYSKPPVKKWSPVLAIKTMEGAAREKLEAAYSNFFRALELCDTELLGECISEGIAVDTKDEQDWTALMRACGLGYSEIVLFLLEKGANPNQTRELLTPLMVCCTHTTVDEEMKLNCVRHLLQFGAQVNLKDKYQTTALIYAASGNYKSIVNALLQVKGIDVNIQDAEGWTALFHAVKRKNLEMVKTLKEAETKLNLKDKFGRTVIDLALMDNSTKIANELGYLPEELMPKGGPKTARERFLDELPDENGEGGFWEDAKAILDAFGIECTKRISLPDLLTETFDNMKYLELGLDPEKKDILNEAIHRYHLKPWSKNSMPKLVKGKELSMEDAIAISGAVAKHLTIINSSVKYVSDRMSERTEDDDIDLEVEKEIVAALVELYELADSTHATLEDISKELEVRIKMEKPGDYIPPFDKNKDNESKVTKYFYLFGTATAMLILYFEADFFYKKLSDTFEFFMETVPSFFTRFSTNKLN